MNKGDKVKPEYRSRWVAKEIKRKASLDLFAATPPWESKKLLFSLAVTRGIGCAVKGMEDFKIDFIDIKRAYFHADARRAVYVRLPPEMAVQGKCGRLLKSLYGTRDAPARRHSWQQS